MRRLIPLLLFAVAACGGGDDLPTMPGIPQSTLSSVEVRTCCVGVNQTFDRLTVSAGTLVELQLSATYVGGLIDPDVVDRTAAAVWEVSTSAIATAEGLAQCQAMVTPRTCFRVRARAPGNVTVLATLSDKGVKNDSFFLTVQ